MNISPLFPSSSDCMNILGYLLINLFWKEEVLKKVSFSVLTFHVVFFVRVDPYGLHKDDGETCSNIMNLVLTPYWLTPKYHIDYTFEVLLAKKKLVLLVPKTCIIHIYTYMCAVHQITRKIKWIIQSTEWCHRPRRRPLMSKARGKAKNSISATVIFVLWKWNYSLLELECCLNIVVFTETIAQSFTVDFGNHI